MRIENGILLLNDEEKRKLGIDMLSSFKDNEGVPITEFVKNLQTSINTLNEVTENFSQAIADLESSIDNKSFTTDNITGILPITKGGTGVNSLTTLQSQLGVPISSFPYYTNNITFPNGFIITCGIIKSASYTINANGEASAYLPTTNPHTIDNLMCKLGWLEGNQGVSVNFYSRWYATIRGTKSTTVTGKIGFVEFGYNGD